LGVFYGLLETPDRSRRGSQIGISSAQVDDVHPFGHQTAADFRNPGEGIGGKTLKTDAGFRWHGSVLRPGYDRVGEGSDPCDLHLHLVPW